MGADLIVAMVAAHVDTTLDFAAGREHVRTLDIQELMESEAWDFVGDHYGNEPDEDELRKYLEKMVGELEEAVVGVYRDSLTIDVGPWSVFIGGGTSWGDSPGDTFDAINFAGTVPGLLDAIGFAWPEPGKPKLQKPEFDSNDAEIEWLTEQLGRHVEFTTEDTP